MAKFIYVEWLVSFLNSQDSFIFEWDEGNLAKSKEKHGITTDQVEAVFFDSTLLPLGEQIGHKTDESRYAVIGREIIEEEILFVCFTIREGKIRPISARKANKKERNIYE